VTHTKHALVERVCDCAWQRANQFHSTVVGVNHHSWQLMAVAAAAAPAAVGHCCETSPLTTPRTTTHHSPHDRLPPLAPPLAIPVALHQRACVSSFHQPHSHTNGPASQTTLRHHRSPSWCANAAESRHGCSGDTVSCSSIPSPHRSLSMYSVAAATAAS
jgi:hypothetical protein